MPFIENLATQMIPQAAGAVYGALMQKQNDRRQINQQQKLTDMQVAAQKGLTDYNTQKQLEMWKNTSYPAQMEMMKKAGLNPALMYGMGGGGGQTAAIAQGSASAGQAQQNPGEIQQYMGMGIQSALAASTIELQQAQAEKLRAEIPKIGADTDLTRVQKDLAQLDLKTKNETYTETVDSIVAAAALMKNNVNISDVQTNTARATAQTTIDTARAELVGRLLQNAMTKSQIAAIGQSIQLSQAQIAKMGQDVAQGWTQLSLEQQKIRIQKAMQEAYGKQVDFNTSQGQRVFDDIIKGVNTIANFLPTPKGNITGPTINVNNNLEQ